MPPQAAEKPATMPHAPALTVRVDLAEVVEAVRAAVSELLVKTAADRPAPPSPEPMAYDGPTAAGLVGRCNEKLLAKYPASRTGRFKLGTRVMYHAERLKKFVQELAEEQAEN